MIPTPYLAAMGVLGFGLLMWAIGYYMGYRKGMIDPVDEKKRYRKRKLKDYLPWG